MPTGCTLHLICGLAGSGKTTLARKLELQESAIRLCPDEWIEPLLPDTSDRTEMDRIRPHIHDIQWALIKRLLVLGNNVVWEQGFWSADERRRFFEQAKTLGARVCLHYLAVPAGELKRRIRARNENLPPGSFHVEPHEIDLWMTWFEPPEEPELSRYDEHHVYEDA